MEGKGKSIKRVRRSSGRPVELTMTNRIFSVLKSEVVNGSLPPDELIVESRVATRFGVSKTPAREALMRLCEMGLLSVTPGRGYTVTKLSWKEVKDLYEVRSAMEGIAAELAAHRIDDATFSQLLEFVGKPLEKKHTIDELITYNFEFHKKLWQAARNDRLVDILSQVMNDLMRAMHTAMYLEDVRELVSQHQKILELVGNRDAGGARKEVQEHIRLTMTRLFD